VATKIRVVINQIRRIMFDWDKYRKYPLSNVEKYVLDKCYVEWLVGNNLVNEMEDMDQPEADLYYEMFKAGWVISQVMSQ